MTCEACDGLGLIRYTERRDYLAPTANGEREPRPMNYSYVAACLCPAGMRVSTRIPRIDRVFSLELVEKLYFPSTGIPQNAMIEVSDTELERVGLPRKMRNWTLKSYPVPDAPQLAAAHEWLNTRPRRDLLLYGPPGTGKTGLAIGMLRSLYASGETAVKFVQANEWLLHLQSSFNRRVAGESELDLLRPAFAPYLLVLDDLNARRADRSSGQMSAYFADVLQLILNKRQGDDRPTILTTNLNVEELQDYLTPTIYDRLREGEFWEFTGASNRTPKATTVLPFAATGRRRAARKKR